MSQLSGGYSSEFDSNITENFEASSSRVSWMFRALMFPVAAVKYGFMCEGVCVGGFSNTSLRGLDDRSK